MANNYDNSAEAAHHPVTVAEVDALLAAGLRSGLRDQNNLTHLLGRMRGTLAQQADALDGMGRQIQDVRLSMSRSGRATTLNPLDALKYIDDEQRDALFTSTARKQMGMLRTMTAAAEAAHADLCARLAQMRAMAAGIAQRPDLPSSTRADFAHLAATLPGDPPPVPHPGLLDYPDQDDDAAARPPVPRQGMAAPGQWGSGAAPTRDPGSATEAPGYDLASMWDADPDQGDAAEVAPAQAGAPRPRLGWPGGDDAGPGEAAAAVESTGEPGAVDDTEPTDEPGAVEEAEPTDEPAPAPTMRRGPPSYGPPMSLAEFSRLAGLPAPEEPASTPTGTEAGPAAQPPATRHKLSNLFKPPPNR